MAEKAQYGQEVTFEEVEVIREMKTDHSDVRYVGTRNHGNVLLMNGEVQFSSADEHRYHEMLVHPVMKTVDTPYARVLILGGGDGLAAREVLKWAYVAEVTIVDFDSTFVNSFGKRHFASLNNHVFEREERVKVVYQDAIAFLNASDESEYTVVFVDLPDPDGPEMVNLYIECIRRIKRVLTTHVNAVGIHIGPVHPNPAFENWNTIHTLKTVLLDQFKGERRKVEFGSVYVPSFGNEWGFMYVKGQYCRYKEDEAYAAYIEKSCQYWSPDTENAPKDISRIFHNK
jgi:spermidine synthase